MTGLLITLAFLATQVFGQDVDEIELFIIGHWELDYDATFEAFEKEEGDKFDKAYRNALTSLWNERNTDIIVTPTTITSSAVTNVYDIVYLGEKCIDLQILSKGEAKMLSLRILDSRLYSSYETCADAGIVKPKWIYSRVGA